MPYRTTQVSLVTYPKESAERPGTVVFSYRTTLLARLVLGEFGPLWSGTTVVHDDGMNPYEGEHEELVSDFYLTASRVFRLLSREYPGSLETHLILPLGQHVEYTMVWSEAQLEEDVLPALRQHELPEVRALYEHMIAALRQHDPQRRSELEGGEPEQDAGARD